MVDQDTNKKLKFIVNTIVVVLVLVIILIVFGVVQFILMTS
ncbi:hypothetical protein PAV_3c02430 [Paenibacillus alvei DSM 29]|nr:hypothetical protein PAV_3c02430 [Paenibacillus alvei DSM 29]